MAALAGGNGGRTPRAPTAAQRNRLLAITLASVAGLMFVMVVSVAVVIHYAEAHHEISGL